jgi:hypothetical protein
MRRPVRCARRSAWRDAMESCANHPDNLAVERCERCQRPLCGECLWYTHDGHRLCAAHAAQLQDAGEEVIPPETYSEAFEHGVRRRTQDSFRPNAAGEYQANKNDLAALFAAMAGLATLIICSGTGAYCLPLAGVILGLVAYSRAQNAVDPQRARLLSIVGVTGSGILLVFMALFFLLYCGLISVALLSSSP